MIVYRYDAGAPKQVGGKPGGGRDARAHAASARPATCGPRPGSLAGAGLPLKRKHKTMDRSPCADSPAQLGGAAVLMAVMIATLGGCGGGTISPAAVKTESHFVSAAAVPAGADDIVIMHLETAQDTDATDTAAPGTDCFPYRFDTEQSLRLSLHEDAHARRMVLSDAQGQVLAEVDRTAPSERVTLPAGQDHTLCVESDGSEAQTHFFRLLPVAEVAVAALSADESTQLLSASPHCEACDLRGVRLPQARLAWADLTGADLSGADFSGSTMSGATLTQAKLQGADFSNVVLNNAFVDSATLHATNFTSADLEWANLQGSSIQGANFTQARLLGATWVNGHLCSYDSDGHCAMDNTLQDALTKP